MPNTNPLTLPANFNSDTFMIARKQGDKIYHAPRQAAEFAAELLANSTQEDIDLAEKVLIAALEGQETREGDPHLGNFLWEREDEAVEDLNAVQFCLFQLIPIMIRHADLLSPDLQDRMRHSIRLGLEEIRRIDVHFRYTNIVTKDITNTCLGAELLDDEDFKNRGYQKFQDWMAFTTRHGCAYEFNSPNYALVAIRVLHRLSELVQHEPTRIGAKTMLARIGLSAALHIHSPTGRWAGPFSRAYRQAVFCETPPEIHTLRDYIEQDILPAWLSDAIDHHPDTFSLTETADSGNGVGITTYHSPSFTLGVSTQELKSQANRFITGQSSVFIAHHKTESDHTGVLYSRYVLNDHWLGDYRSTPARSNTQILFEEGQCHNVQDGARAIVLYSPKDLGAMAAYTSAKTVICWHDRNLVDEVWVNDQKVDTFPTDIPEGATVVVATGPVLTAIRALTRTDLGRNAPLRLVEHGTHLFLEIYNYLGPAKTFWEQAHPGSFYQGKPQCGFFAELAERSDYSTPQAFAQTVSGGTLKDTAESPVTYEAGKTRTWSVEYARAGKTLGIEIDLLEWYLQKRWNQDGPLGWPQLESPVARQNRTGTVTVQDATLTCGNQPAWLFACPETNRYVAAFHGSTPEPLTLSVPDGRVDIDAMGTGAVIWDNGEVTIEALEIEGEVQVTGGRIVSYAKPFRRPYILWSKGESD
ncbi:MAG: hypothetical protein O7G87_10970 [bacterium]|nr:hypothetical protein [bacterium]